MAFTTMEEAERRMIQLLDDIDVYGSAIHCQEARDIFKQYPALEGKYKPVIDELAKPTTVSE